MPTYIIDHMYIHVNPSVLLKATRANKELYSSSLVVFPKKEYKQDKVNLFFTSTISFSIYTAWHLVWEAAPLILFVGLLHQQTKMKLGRVR